MAKPRIVITDGAYVVEGDIPLYLDAIAPSEDGSHLEYRRIRTYDTGGGTYLLCRCGRSSTKPFCDYCHMTESPVFDGAETASREPYAKRAQLFAGNGLNMYDDGKCAYARLCHHNGRSVWDMSDEDDGQTKVWQAAAAWECPTGRLVAEDADSGQVYEQEYEPSIIVLEDTELGCSGPLFVRGGIELVGQDGYVYERRNRYALCRCGHSQDMPFCDATHHHAECFDSHLMFDDACVPSSEACRRGAEEAGVRDVSFVERPDAL